MPYEKRWISSMMERIVNWHLQTANAVYIAHNKYGEEVLRRDIEQVLITPCSTFGIPVVKGKSGIRSWSSCGLSSQYTTTPKTERNTS